MFEHKSRFLRIASPVGACLLLFLSALVVGCDEDDGARIVGPTGKPTLLKDWKGTMTAHLVSGSDTLLTRIFLVRISFADSTFSYRYVSDYGYTVDPYVGSGMYELTDSLVQLNDTTTYPDWVDRNMTPITDEPYLLTLERTSAVLFWTHDYSGGIRRTQRFNLQLDD
jgi:hypothetical protein